MKSFLIFLICLIPTLGFSQEGYDPFADYSEFEEATEEEADINFFRNGRFLTIGVRGGIKGFTSTFGNLYEQGSTFGLFLAFFFDLKLSMQIGYSTSSHKAILIDPSGPTIYTGSMDMTATNFSLKYFFTTQNVTKGLGKFNPYLRAGISQIYRTYRFPDLNDAYARDGAMGFDGGIGFEMPLSNNSMYIGAEISYVYANFPDEGSRIENLNTTFNGDLYQAIAILGVNF